MSAADTSRKVVSDPSAPRATGPESPVARTRHTAGNGRIIGWRAARGRVRRANFAAARRQESPAVPGDRQYALRGHEDSFALTFAETAAMSARPANLDFNAA